MKKVIHIAIIILLCSLVSKLDGQIKGIYSQNYLNKYELNPAYAGFDFSLSVYSTYRKQWQDIVKSPTAMYVGAHLPYYIWNGAIGMQVDRRSLGAFTIQSLDLSYNYITPMWQGFLSMGARLGGTYSNLDGQEIVTPEGVYNTNIDHKDPLLETLSMSGSGVRYAAGLYYFAKNMEVGVGIENVPSSRIFFNSFTVDNSLTYNALFQYKLKPVDNILLKPTVVLYGNADNLQLQGMLHGEYNGSIFGGIGVRGYTRSSMESIIFLIGSRVTDNVRISYSYDIGVSKYAGFHSGSHEILVNYNFNKPIGTGVSQKIIYNTRNL